MVARLRVALLFGGRSAEHDVSVMSAGNVFRALDPARYDTVPIGITRSGTWLLCSLRGGKFPTAVPESGPRVALIPGGSGRLAILSETDGAAPDLARSVDVVFPVLHGPFGEDGTVQGLAEIAGVAYVGSGVLGSAAAMDKDVAKRLMRDAGLPIARFVSFMRGDEPAFEAVVAELGRPVFVKPARLGSSVGISKAGTRGGVRQSGRRGVPPRPQDPGRGICSRPRDRVRRARGRGRLAHRLAARRDRAEQPPRLLHLRGQISR